MKIIQHASQNSFNPENLVRHCSPIIGLYGELKNSKNIGRDSRSLYTEFQQLIKNLEIKLGAERFDGEIIKLTSYSLCCALDELMSFTYSTSEAAINMDMSLLFSFHNEMPQAANLLKLAKRIIDQRNPALIEVQKLIYIIIELGYKGTLLESPDNANLLYSIKRVLANNVIDHNKSRPPLNFIQGTRKSRPKFMSGIPLWVSLSFSALILASVYRIGDIYLSKMYSKIAIEQKIISNNRSS